ncbi:Long chain fatty acid CoA ligase [Spironucleus salmonicida]|uniref:Long chain fatty acid CoA ligase n=1 Tax=Spironucleus salmonicida TaxID=348837 RepID=V6LQK5_9EUKA|nr:Long chain fatty acid CoA ligase [Spironucleus salmonicida]|eukprot:EST43039.1 Long chain fatty acid CoA ligase [Spironucleus salmonicida]
MFVKPHDHASSSHLPLNEKEEYPLDTTIPENFMNSLSRNKARNFMSYRAGLSTSPKLINEKFQSITYAQSTLFIAKIRDQLLALGAQKQDRISVYAKNSPLWLLSDLAISFANCVTVPIFDTLSIENIVYCWNLTGVKFVFTSEEYLPNVIGMVENCKSVKKIIVFDQVQVDDKLVNAASKVYSHISDSAYQIIDDTKSMYSVQSTKTVISEAVDFSQITPRIKAILSNQTDVKIAQIELPEQISLDLAEKCMENLYPPVDQVFSEPNSVIFTSGTSGHPKAAVLSHKNVCAGGACLGRQFVPYSITDSGQQSTMLSYLPLAHVFERCMEHLCAFRGYNIYYSSGNMKTIAKDFELAQVSVFMGVPRVYQKIYDNVMKQLSEQNILIRTVFNSCYNIKKLYLNSNPAHYRTGKLSVIDNIAFKKIQKSLGGKVEYVISGSSALPPEVEEFLRICTGARLTLGYGLTELSTTGLYNYCGMKMNTPYQLGFSSAFTEAKIVQCDQCEFTLERDQTGELCIKGPGVCMGYIDGQWGKLTKVVDNDGFYHTGDLCKLHEDGSASFIRRISLVVKLQHGEFVDLGALEGVLESSPLITCAFVHAEPSKAAPVAIVCVDSKVCNDRFGTTDPIKLSDLIEKEGDRLVRLAGLKGFNVPRAYKVLVDVDWSSDRKLMTPTQKKQHINLRIYFKSDLDDLFKKCDHGSKHIDGASIGQGIGTGTLVSAACIVVAVVAFFAIK